MEIAINYWAVLGAAVASFVLGALWYGPVFGKPWMRLMGFTPESMKAMTMTPTKAMIGIFIGSLLTSYVLAHAIVFGIAYTGIAGALGGMMAGFYYWLGFALPLTATAYLVEGKSAKLWFLNAAYYLVSFLIAGAILGAWPA